VAANWWQLSALAVGCIHLSRVQDQDEYRRDQMRTVK